MSKVQVKAGLTVRKTAVVGGKSSGSSRGGKRILELHWKQRLVPSSVAVRWPRVCKNDGTCVHWWFYILFSFVVDCLFCWGQTRAKCFSWNAIVFEVQQYLTPTGSQQEDRFRMVNMDLHQGLWCVSNTGQPWHIYSHISTVTISLCKIRSS